MKTIRIFFAYILLGLAAPTLALASDECRSYKWDVSHEVALYHQPAAGVTAAMQAQLAPQIQSEQHYLVSLLPQDGVQFSAPPSKRMLSDGAYAGLLKLRVSESGSYRIAIDSGFWLDVVADGKAIGSTDFNGSQGCDGPHKIVVYPLPANVDLILQMSAASRSSAHVTVTRVANSTP